MKDKVVTIAGMALLLVLGLSAWTQAHPAAPAAAQQAAQPASETRRITVSGEAEVRVVPDEVIVTLGVET